MDSNDFFGDLSTGETIVWMLVLFAAVLWWGFQPWVKRRRQNRDEGASGPGDA